jgi:alpha-mannosidase
MTALPRLLTTVIFYCLLGVSAGAGETSVLWQIGERDGDTAEFALGPAGYRDYDQPGLFIAGSSDPKQDWPYVQPGPVDAWADSTPHTFTVLFDLQKPSGARPYRLVVDLADTQAHFPPKLRVSLNGTVVEEVATPAGKSDRSIEGSPREGRPFRFAVEFESSDLRHGVNRLELTTVSGCWILYDSVRFEGPAGARLSPVPDRCVLRSATAMPCLIDRDGEVLQPITLDLFRIGGAVTAQCLVNGKEAETVELKSGGQQITVGLPEVSEPTPTRIAFVSDGETLLATEVTLRPVRRWEVHLIHQTHLDIGYTHTQEEVLQRQVEYLRQALEYIDETKDYPEEARFVWHPEGMWAVDEFMRLASEEEKERFVEACRRRQIHLDVLYAQAMTGMYTEEELFELMGAAKRFEADYDVPIDSAMQSDVPGYTWGLASALAHHGVKYISIGPNHFHRMGYTFEWGDKPFWWVSPSGAHRVLFWMCGNGYAYFHSRRLDENAIFSYLEGLEAKDYPYEMTLMRYCIGGDNGPPNRELSDFVRNWNETYVAPKLVIARNSEALKQFAERYGEDLPVIRGDFTPYWEDGSASTALATGVNRRACERIAQVQTLWAMVRPELSLHVDFDRAWTKMVMYDEHTWGAHNSISQPDHAFAIQQDEYKQQFAFDGAAMTEKLLAQVVESSARTDGIDVYNTAYWPRDGLVVLTPEQSKAGDLVVTEQGRVIASQRLASGDLAFVARDVPAFGAQRFWVRPGAAEPAGRCRAEGLRLANGRVSLAIDPATGAIRSLRLRSIDRELVDPDKGVGLNDYLYIIGRDPEQNRATITGDVQVTVEDPGPLVATLRIESEAPGCARLVRRVRLVDGFDHVELVNTADKLQERRPEGLYFEFPFSVPNAEARVDVPWAVVEVEKDQMWGANRNFYCVQRFIDLSNEDYGVTWVPVDAPMVQFDPIKIAQAGGRQWWRTFIDPEPYLHSWTMNNHWETNYKADQEGEITFRYVLRPHIGGYDGAEAQRFGREVCQPLLVVPATADAALPEPLLRLVGSKGVVVTSVRPSRDGEALLIRLFAASGEPGQVTLEWREPKRLYRSSPQEERGDVVEGPIELPGFGIVTLRAEPSASAPRVSP